MLWKMSKSSRPELAVEKSGLPKSKVSMKEFGVDDDVKGLLEEAGLCFMASSLVFGGVRSRKAGIDWLAYVLSGSAKSEARSVSS